MAVKQHAVICSAVLFFVTVLYITLSTKFYINRCHFNRATRLNNSHSEKVNSKPNFNTFHRFSQSIITNKTHFKTTLSERQPKVHLHYQYPIVFERSFTCEHLHLLLKNSKTIYYWRLPTLRRKSKRSLLKLLLLSGTNLLNPGPTCNKCTKEGRKNQLTIQCTLCKRNYHKTCMLPNISYKDFHELSQNWTCDRCNSICKVCNRKDRRMKLAECVSCDQIFHVKCLKSINCLTNTDELEWKCSECTNKQNEQLNRSITSFLGPSKTKNTTLPKGIKIGHVNVRDILSKTKKDDITQVILQYDFDVFGISESWLTDDIATAELEIENYHLIRPT